MNIDHYIHIIQWNVKFFFLKNHKNLQKKPLHLYIYDRNNTVWIIYIIQQSLFLKKRTKKKQSIKQLLQQ